ncbi:hypothetical protein EDF58_102496 [Novosphingobium sp. PhB57]|nr:hypothetical protein EDF58_102496 [Novosphingobium sp. PhB57]
MKQCLDLVLVQTLILNAREVQATIADLSLSLTEPAHGLVAHMDGYIRASGLNRIFAKVADTARSCFSGYMNSPERNAHRRDRIAARTPGKPVAPPRYAKVSGSVAKIVEHLISPRLEKLPPRQLVKLRRQVDRFTDFARTALENEPNHLQTMPKAILGTSQRNEPRTEIETTSKLAAAARYSGMGPLKCASVSICRFVQSAGWLSEQFKRAERAYEAHGRLPYNFGGHLPAFDMSKMPAGSKTHIIMLLDSFRRVILEDAAFGSKSGRKEEIARFDNQGKNEVNAAIAWLTLMGARLTRDDEGDINCERRTFHLLDVLPELRLNRARM